MIHQARVIAKQGGIFNMDVYRALNIDMPQLLFTVMHQSGPAISDEDFTHTVTALQMDIRRQAQEVGEELHLWLRPRILRLAGLQTRSGSNPRSVAALSRLHTL